MRWFGNLESNKTTNEWTCVIVNDSELCRSVSNRSYHPDPNQVVCICGITYIYKSTFFKLTFILFTLMPQINGERKLRYSSFEFLWVDRMSPLIIPLPEIALPELFNWFEHSADSTPSIKAPSSETEPSKIPGGHLSKSRNGKSAGGCSSVCNLFITLAESCKRISHVNNTKVYIIHILNR